MACSNVSAILHPPSVIRSNWCQSSRESRCKSLLCFFLCSHFTETCNQQVAPTRAGIKCEENPAKNIEGNRPQKVTKGQCSAEWPAVREESSRLNRSRSRSNKNKKRRAFPSELIPRSLTHRVVDSVDQRADRLSRPQADGKRVHHSPLCFNHRPIHRIPATRIPQLGGGSANENGSAVTPSQQFSSCHCCSLLRGDDKLDANQY